MTSRNERFVSAARRLLLMQLVACLLALGVAGWAWFEVRGLVRERDALAARVAQLEREHVIPAAAQPKLPAPARPVRETAVAATGMKAAPSSPEAPAASAAGDTKPTLDEPDGACVGINRRPMRCVPPFTATPIGGVCLDGRSRPMRCPPGEPAVPRGEEAKEAPARR